MFWVGAGVGVLVGSGVGYAVGAGVHETLHEDYLRSEMQLPGESQTEGIAEPAG